MSEQRFFDTSDKEDSGPDETPTKPNIRNIMNRDLVEAANRTIREAGFDPDLSVGGKAQVDQGVVPIRYTNVIIGNWQIDHGARGDDYMFQMIPRRPIKADVRAVLEGLITVIASFIPNDVEVFINPPNPGLEIDFYTIRLEDVLKKPGAESVVSEKLPTELGQIDAWAT
jgi:hypothetical protein